MISKLHQRLRTATRKDHEALENTPLMQALSSPQLDEAGYLAAIAVLYGFWSRHLDAADPALGPLRADLASFGVDPAGLPVMPPELVRSLDEPVDHLARDYLLHGSSLGGTVICRRLGARYGQAWIGSHASHFASAADQGAAAWRLYLQELADAALTEPEEDRLLKQASTLFENLRKWALQMPAIQIGSSVQTIHTLA